MEFFVDSPEVVLIDMGVDLGGGHIGVAEHLLHDAQVGSALQ